MSEVFQIGIAKGHSQKIETVKKIVLLAGKGITGDRHLNKFNNPYNQLTLIESENIDNYNKKNNLKIPYLSFRRNIVTKNIKLNDLIGKKLRIGNTEVKVNDLCRPCKHLQIILNQNNIIKEFLRKGGLRCEILTSGNIKVGDLINIL